MVDNINIYFLCRFGWVLASIKNYSNKATHALFHQTLYVHSRGLSRSGKDALAQFGWGLSSKTFSTLFSQWVKLYQAALCSSLLCLPHAFWIDNYNKGYQHLQCNIDKGSYFRIDGTSLVLVLLKPIKTTSLSLFHTNTPSSLPTSFLPEKFQPYYEKWDAYHQPSIREDSIAEQLQIFNNPLKPETGAEDPSRFVQQCLSITAIFPLLSCYSQLIFSATGGTEVTYFEEKLPAPVSHYLPLDLWPDPIGANKGFDDVLVKIKEFYKQYPFAKQFFGIVDQNIFYRHYKVSLDPWIPRSLDLWIPGSLDPWIENLFDLIFSHSVH
jgi:hypothetical protein